MLDALAHDFIKHKFDVKYVIRTILNSRVYQLSSEPTPANQYDQQNFARHYAQRLIAEVFFDAVNQATGAKGDFNGVAAGRGPWTCRTRGLARTSWILLIGRGA